MTSIMRPGRALLTAGALLSGIVLAAGALAAPALAVTARAGSRACRPCAGRPCVGGSRGSRTRTCGITSPRASFVLHGPISTLDDVGYGWEICSANGRAEKFARLGYHLTATRR